MTNRKTIEIVILTFSLLEWRCSKLLHKTGTDNEPSFITATVNGRVENYYFTPSGSYDTTKHSVLLKASDTAGVAARTWLIVIQLGKSRLEKLSYPFVFY